MHAPFVLRVAVAASAVLALALPATSASAAPVSSAHAAAASAHHPKHLARTPRPTIHGKPRVGHVLTAHAGAWKPKHVRLHYRWYVDGHAVKGATSRSYTVRTSDAGDAVQVAVRGTKHGYRSVTKRSRAVHVPAAGSSTPPSSGTPAPPSGGTPTPPKSTDPIPGDGQYLVGSGVQAGVYVTRSATDSCYWERDSSFDGSFDSIIANDLGSGQRIITIKATDYGVSFSGCGAWIRRADAPAIGAVTTGVYLVGQQLATGTYQASVPAGGCYWATLSDFDGSTDSIIANDFATGSTAIVDISSSVAGFETSGCGPWSKIG